MVTSFGFSIEVTSWIFVWGMLYTVSGIGVCLALGHLADVAAGFIIRVYVAVATVAYGLCCGTEDYPANLSQLSHGIVDYLPSTVDINRGAPTKTGQVLDLGRPPTIKRDTFEDILADAEVPTTHQRWVQFTNMATS